MNMYTICLLLSCFILYSKGATHWIVTENGRIEQQANSFFDLKKPFDLVAFIHQEQRLNKMNVLQNELNQEKEILPRDINQKHTDISKTFFKKDSSCNKMKKRLHDMDWSLNHIISLNSKGINIADHIDLSIISTNDELNAPVCHSNIPFTLLTFEHLNGIAERHMLPNISEPDLLSVISYARDINNWGHMVENALQKNSSSWILQNMAALFWRVKGNTTQAVNCLRQALYNSPREHRDMALLSLAIVLHLANHSTDSLVLLHASLETTNHLPLHYFALGSIYASLGMLDTSELCFQYVVEAQPDFLPALEMLQSVVCEKRYMQALKEQQRNLKKSINKLQAFHHRHPSLVRVRVHDQHIKKLPLKQFTKQLHWFTRNHARGTIHLIRTNQNVMPIMQLNANEMKNLHEVKATDMSKVSSEEPFTKNIQVEHVKIIEQQQETLVGHSDTENIKGQVLTRNGKTSGKDPSKKQKKLKENKQEKKITKRPLNSRSAEMLNQDRVNEKSSPNDVKGISSIQKKQVSEDKTLRALVNNKAIASLEDVTKNSLSKARQTLAHAKSVLNKSIMQPDLPYPYSNSIGSCSKSTSLTSVKEKSSRVRKECQTDTEYLSSSNAYDNKPTSPSSSELNGPAANTMTYRSKDNGNLESIQVNISPKSTPNTNQERTIKNSSKSSNKKILKEKIKKNGKHTPSSKEVNDESSSGKEMRSNPFNPNECNIEFHNMEALTRNEKFSVVTNFASKGIDVRHHINFKEDVTGFPKPPRCLGTIQTGQKSFDHLKSIKAIAKVNLPPEDGIKQTLLMHASDPQTTVDEVGTRIRRALHKNSTSWVLLNLASIYWRIMGDTNEAVRCLRLALANSHTKIQDVSLINMASILLRGGFFEDAATISRAVLKIYPHAMIAHFTLANSLAALGKITEATQHFLLVLQIEPGFMPAVERLKTIQCILWKQQKELEREAEQLRLLLTDT